MELKLKQNAVLVGCIDTFCLVCEEYFVSYNDTEEHIGKLSHQNRLNAAPYMDNYRSDNIRKVRTGYFCEFCNILLTTAKKVAIHVTKSKHLQDKNTYHLKRIGTGVIVCDAILITDDAFSGLMEDTCAVCNVEYSDQKQHRNDTQHLLSLVQSKFEFVDNSIYRKVDDCTLQCLTCNIIIGLDSKTVHFDDIDHIKQYSECQLAYQEYVDNNAQKIAHVDEFNKDSLNGKQNVTNTNDGSSLCIDSMDLVESAQDSETNREEINQVSLNGNEDATDNKKSGLKCSTSDDLPTTNNCRAIVRYHETNENNTENIKTNTDNLNTKDDNVPIVAEAIDAVSERDRNNEETDIGVFAAEHKLTYNSNNNDAYCRSCHCRIPATLGCLQEHVFGKRHKRIGGFDTVKKTGNRIPSGSWCSKSNIRKMQTERFVESETIIKPGVFGDTTVIINDQLFLKYVGYMLITRIDSRYRCLICETNLFEDDLITHGESYLHESKLKNILVVTSLPTEFVREIRPDCFHCGYCNLVVGDWEHVENHLECSEHRSIKCDMKTKLLLVLPSIIRQREVKRKKAFMSYMMLRMMSNSFFSHMY